MRSMVERAQRAGEVERGVVERQPRRIRLDELGIGGRPLAREREQLRHEIDTDDLAHQRREGESERARTGAHVERTLVASRLHERAHALGERGCAIILALGHASGRARPPVRSRRRHAVPALGHC